MTRDMTTTTTTEAPELEILEAVIERNRGTEGFYGAGSALRAIRDHKLYRVTHTRFDAYVRDRWEMKGRTAYQLIVAAGVVDTLRNCAYDRLPGTESQARPLTVKALTPDQVCEVWGIVLETAPDGRVTAQHVKATVGAYLGTEPRRRAERVQHPDESSRRDGDSLSDLFRTAADAAAKLDHRLSPGMALGLDPSLDDWYEWLRVSLREASATRLSWGWPANTFYFDLDTPGAIFRSYHDDLSAIHYPMIYVELRVGVHDGRAAGSLAGGARSLASSPFDSTDPYTVLGVTRGVKQRAITSAYRALVKQYHPDKVGADIAPELRSLAQLRTAQINAAYEKACARRSDEDAADDDTTVAPTPSDTAVVAQTDGEGRSSAGLSVVVRSNGGWSSIGGRCVGCNEVHAGREVQWPYPTLEVVVEGLPVIHEHAELCLPCGRSLLTDDGIEHLAARLREGHAADLFGGRPMDDVFAPLFATITAADVLVDRAELSSLQTFAEWSAAQKKGRRRGRR